MAKKLVAKSNALHFGGIGLVDEDHDDYLYPGIFVRFTEFSGNKEIETETDEGHTGKRTLSLGEARSKASASPEITDMFRLNQGLEDFCYHTLGKMVETRVNPAGEDYKTTYKQEITPDANSNLPLVHILHGFNDGVQGCRVYKNGLANELTLTMNSEEKPTVKCAYVSDYPIYRGDSTKVSPVFEPYVPKALKSGSFSVYFAPFIDGVRRDINESTDRIECLTESEITVNNNIEPSTCAGGDFGESIKDVKNLEVSGSMTLRYVNKDIERLFSTGDYDREKVTDDSIYGAMRFKYQTSYVEVDEQGKKLTVPILFQVDLPNACISNAQASESGDDVKTISLELTANESLSVEQDISVTDLIKITTQSALKFMSGTSVTTHRCKEMADK